LGGFGKKKKTTRINRKTAKNHTHTHAKALHCLLLFSHMCLFFCQCVCDRPKLTTTSSRKSTETNAEKKGK